MTVVAEVVVDVGSARRNPAGTHPAGPAGPDQAETDQAGAERLGHRLIPSAWLAFVALPLIDTWSGRHLMAYAVGVSVLAAGFAALFVYASSATGVRRQTWSRAHNVAVVVAFFSTPVFLCFVDGPGWDYLFVYGLLPTMRLAPQRVRYRLVLGVTALAVVVGALSSPNLGDVIAPASVVLGTGAGWLGFGRLIEANAALKRAQDERARVAVAEERLRFARDLHDLLGHSLSVITLKSEVAGRLLAGDSERERARAEVAEIEDVARRALKEVREAVGGYRLATVGIELAGARSALAAACITWSEDVDVDVELPRPIEAVLAWSIREGVTNVVRHSGAANCALTMAADGEAVSVAVVDDGAGSSGAAAGGSTGGNGLRGLRERVAAVAGSLSAGPTDSGGYRLAVSIPLRGWRAE